jgi:hypothetical protein
MLGVLILCLYLLSGGVIAFNALRGRDALTRVWLGGSLGFVMMMWFPSLFAYALKFTLAAQWAAVSLAALCAAASFALRGRRGGAGVADAEKALPGYLALIVILPILILSAYLQHTHTLRDVDGALHVGQSTYGDLAMHIGFATGLRGASYPPEYTLLPGTRIGYPFLMDALSGTMLLFGSTIRQAFILPSVAMMGLVFLGFLLLAYRMTGSKRASVLAFYLLFLNGGLGFLYTLDRVIADPSRLRAALFDFYNAPTNMPALNLRWSNVIADMMIPQRTLLAGWLMGIPAIWLLFEALRDVKSRGRFIALGIWVGFMPMVHTHTFFAIGLLSIAAFVHRLIADKREDKPATAAHFVLYGAIALAAALPQLIAYTFPQSTGSGALAFRFDWVNSTDGKLIDEYFWFWVKNVGLIYLCAIPAFRRADARQRTLALGALLIYLIADLVQFQTNEYDNNKLFYIAFIIMLPLIANYLVALFDRLKGFQGRYLFAALFIAASVASGGLTLARECVSDYQLFSKDDVTFADYVERNTPADATFLTGTQHVNPIAVLAGRKIVCGSSLYLYFHGVDYQARQSAVYDMYQSPGENLSAFTDYQVDYAYISSWEQSDFALDQDFFDRNFPLVYREGDSALYAVSARARALLPS